MMIKSSENDDKVSGFKTGFSFKRKRENEQFESRYQQVKQTGHQNSDQKVEIKISLQKIHFISDEPTSISSEIDLVKTKNIIYRKETLEQKDFQPKEKGSLGTLNNQRKEKVLAQSGEDIEIKEISDENNDSSFIRDSGDTNLNIIKLPPYPVDFIPFNLEQETYNEENPYKRLQRMVVDICLKEKTILSKEYKAYSFFLKILENFIQKLEQEVKNKLNANMKEGSSSSKIIKDNLQNIFEIQKRKVIEKLLEEHDKTNVILGLYDEATTSKGRLFLIIEEFHKFIQNDNKLFLDFLLSKRVDSQREELEKRISQKVKFSLQELNSQENKINNIHKEIDEIAKKLEQNQKRAYLKVFKEYTPIFEIDSSNLIKNFLSL